MRQRELDLKYIINQFSIWEVNLKNLSSVNLLDANQISEDLIAQVLNCVFGYNLKNANLLKKNFPSIDLIDDSNSIAIQVTTSNSKNKVQLTLNKFKEFGYDERFERLMIFIMGKKQKSYPSLVIPNSIVFDVNNDILDFAGLIHVINYLPSTKLTKLKQIISRAEKTEESTKVLRKEHLQKKALTMEKKFLKDFINKNLTKEDLDFAYYELRITINYGSAIIRDVGDRTFPGGDFKNPKWSKMDFLGRYDYGVEFVREGPDAIFDSNGNWDLLTTDDLRQSNQNYRTVRCWIIYRLSYQDIITYEIEQDPYYGYPTIYCHFKYDGWPWEEIKFGQPGNAKLRQKQFYFDDSKRKTLK